MTFKIIVFVFSTWIAMSLLCGIAEGVIVGGSGLAGTQSTLNTLMYSDFASVSFARSLGSMLIFKFPALFTSGYVMAQWLFFLAPIAAFGVMMAAFILSHIPLIGRGS